MTTDDIINAAPKAIQLAKKLGKIVCINARNLEPKVYQTYRNIILDNGLIDFYDLPEQEPTVCDVYIDLSEFKDAIPWPSISSLGVSVIDVVGCREWTYYDCYRWNGTGFDMPAPTTANLPKYTELLESQFPELDLNAAHFEYAGPNNISRFDRCNILHVVANIKDAIEQGKKLVVFNNIEETMDYAAYHRIRRIAQLVNRPDIPFYHVTAMYDAYEYGKKFYELFKEHSPIEITCISYNFFWHVSHNETLHQKIVKDINKENFAPLYHTLNKPFRVGERSHKYINFNRMLRPHRIVLFLELLRRDPDTVFNKSFTSFDPSWDQDISGLELKIDYDLTPVDPSYREIFEQYRNKLPLRLSSSNGNPVRVTEDDLQYVDNTYFSVITETVCLTSPWFFNGTFFSEKIYKPFLYKHPFVLVCRPGALADLHQHGFKTFSPWIDESYDDIEDDFERIRAVADEITRLSNLSTSEWIEIQQNIAPILEYNFDVFTMGRMDLRITPRGVL